jgi:CHRD domain
MKRLTTALGTLAIMSGGVVWGCGGNSSTATSPSNTVVFSVPLLGTNEVTLASQAEIAAKGTAVITVHKDTNAVDFAVSLSGFPNGSSAILSHIHGPNAPAGVATGVYIDTGLNAGTAIQMPNGSATYNLTAQSDATHVGAVLANPSQFYFNVHTPVNPGGAIRGQLQ